MPNRDLEHAETVRRKRYAFEQRSKAVPLREIADELGVSHETIRKWVSEGIQTFLPPAEAEEARALEADRYDASERRILECLQWCASEAQRRSENEQPIGHQLEQMAMFEERLSQVRRARAKLLGLDTPMKVAHTLTVRTEFDAEVEELASQLLGGGHLLSTPDQVDVGADE